MYALPPPMWWDAKRTFFFAEDGEADMSAEFQGVTTDDISCAAVEWSLCTVQLNNVCSRYLSRTICVEKILS